MAFVLSSITSVLSLVQWRPFAYQPALTTADNTPTGWSAVGLPPGMSISAATGLISGAPSSSGVYTATIRAFAAGGLSSALPITIGVEATSVSSDTALDLWIDITTRKVSVVNPATAGAVATANPAAAIVQALFYAKSGDDMVFAVRFVKGSNVVDLTLSSLKLWMKELEPDAAILSSGTWKKVGSGASSYFLFYLRVASEELASAFQNYESDGGTFFDALAEIEWIELNRWYPGATPVSLRQTTSTFKVQLERSLA